MSDISATEYLSRQQELEDEARKLMPWDPRSCTYEKGALRQQVFACRTHGNIGICYSCSIQCHTSCDIVELFTKRNFTCDCGTERDKPKSENQQTNEFRCQLRKNREPDVASLQNVYGHNFHGLFCSCNEEYDPDSSAVMLQCVLGAECNEDWYHDYCIVGKGKEKQGAKRKADEETLADGMPPLDSFDAFICWKCVSKYDYYFQKLMSHSLAEEVIAHRIQRGSLEEKDLSRSDKKRPIDDVTDGSIDYSLTLKHGYSKQLAKIKETLDKKTDKLYKFLDDLVPFLVNDDPVYEEPEDTATGADDMVSLLLQSSVQREQAVAGISAFNSLKTRLSEYLRPFAESGRVVSGEDINNFFEGNEKK
ncbi:hypothetical protein HG536_0D02390 [Torulaspora globosa]|uniref:UBR-type domain-containing protein n=1 Tax=Torulaspora globosa TaxID=48254 RepID=A0A7G3ZGT1_9SACH|nr:uncharacterized protein HG536_0D02390 [Torulaspora globosa]QLL32717.1 hypothetical protein HG536_0D02390 [Torulaspora globosa]